MSQKPKQKQKKSESLIQLEHKYDELRSQLIDKDNRIKQLEQSNNSLGIINHNTSTQFNLLKAKTAEEISKLNLSLQNLKFRVSQLTTNKHQLEIQNATLIAKLDYERKNYEDYRKQKERQMEDYKKHISIQVGKYENQASEYTIAINERQALFTEKNQLLKMLTEQREQHRLQLADKNREKIQALDSLKQKMKDQIHQMENNLLKIRRDQMSNNTRLALLQNNQLIQQLEYQSTNTHQIVTRNIQLQKKIKQMQNEVAIQKEVEHQISKRAVLSKKIVKKLMQKNQSLEREQQNAKISVKSLEQKNNQYEKLKKCICQLNDALASASAQMETLQKQNILKSTQLLEIKQKYQLFMNQGTKIEHLIVRYYDEILQGKGLSPNYVLDIQNLKSLEIQKWSKSQVQIVLNALINSLRPHLNIKIFDIQYRKNIINQKIMTQQKQNHNDIQENITSNRLRNISLQKNKIFYQAKRKLSNCNSQQLLQHRSISQSKLVQSKIRQWGNQATQTMNNKKIADRFYRSKIK